MLLEFDNCYPPADYSAKERSLIAFVSQMDGYLVKVGA